MENQSANTQAAGLLGIVLFFAVVIAVLVFATIVYMLPAIVANFRRHPMSMQITINTLFLGWTGIGWLVSLIWAMSNTYISGFQEKRFR